MSNFFVFQNPFKRVSDCIGSILKMADMLKCELETPNSLKPKVIGKTKGWKKKAWNDLPNHLANLPFEQFDRKSLEIWNHGLSVYLFSPSVSTSQSMECFGHFSQNNFGLVQTRAKTYVFTCWHSRELCRQTCRALFGTYPKSHRPRASSTSKCLPDPWYGLPIR